MSRVPAPLNWWRLLPLDVCVAGAVVVAVSALCLARVPVILDRVKLSGTLVFLSTEKAEAAERYAVTGRLDAPPQDNPAPLGDGPFKFTRQGGSLFASGVLRDGQPAFELAFTPSVDPRSLGWSMLWLCGHRQPEPGWTAPLPPAPVHGLSDLQLPQACRAAPNP